MGRGYAWRYYCMKCGRPYAKKVYWMRHIRSCQATTRHRWVRTGGRFHDQWVPAR